MSPEEAKELSEKSAEDELEQGPSTQAINLECTDNLRLNKMNKAGFGKAFRVYCPKGCKDANAFLFGTQIYHEVSSICKAAIHDGKIENDKGGEFIIVNVDNPHVYFAENQHGISSTTI